MTRWQLCLLAGLWLGSAPIQAVPAKRPYEPEENLPPPVPIVVLSGTTWMGKDSTVNNRCLFFENDGSLSYGVNKATYRNGTWKLEGQTLYFEMNHQFREFKGTVQGNLIIGESWNKTGKRWDTVFQRIPQGK